MATNTDVINSAELRDAIQIAGLADTITLTGPSPYVSVVTLGKRSSFSPPATPFSGYSILGNASTLSDSRLYQQNVDGPYSPGLIQDLTLQYTPGGAADGGPL